VRVAGEADGDNREEAVDLPGVVRTGGSRADQADAAGLQAHRYWPSHAVRLHRFELLPSEYDLTVTLYYEYMPRTLREYLMESQLRGEELTERQLFSIIYGVETGLQSLAAAGIQHGCINLETVLFKNGLFKITDISSTTRTPPSTQTSLPTNWSCRAVAISSCPRSC
jgi:serine/threonine protein kinase